MCLQLFFDFGYGQDDDNVLCELSFSVFVFYELKRTPFATEYILFYVKGVIAQSASAPSVPRNVNRAYNYFGKSNWDGDVSANAYFDDLKFFNRALSSTEIINDLLWLNDVFLSLKYKLKMVIIFHQMFNG